MTEKPKGKGWKQYVCVNATAATYLKAGETYWLRKVRNGWLEDSRLSRFAAFRFKKVPA